MTTPLPKTIGKYKILRELGRGGNAVVYLGHDPFTRRNVAIKTAFAETIDDPVARGRAKKQFLKEASLVGQINHPHIIKVYDAVIGDDHSYLVMEYVSGGTLKPFCHPAHLLPMEKVVEITFKCCQALDYASRHGIIHRDIKPANIMLHGDMDLKITDFGAAWITHGEQTRLNGLVGSPAYMSPEQIEDSVQDFHTDMYSLGVVMYELLTGRLPFTAENDFALTYKIINETPPPPRLLRPAIPRPLEEIVLRAMQKDPAARYPVWETFTHSLAEVSDTLEPVAGGITDTEKFNLLKRLKFFHDFGDIELWEVLRFSTWRRFPAGQVLVKEGNTGNAVFILAVGEVKISKQQKVLSLLSAGDCFGELSALDDTLPRSATVTALNDDVLLIKIKASALRSASENCRLAFNEAFLRILVERLARMEAKLANLILDIPV